MNEIACPVCTVPIEVRLARGRKSGKPFVMLVCAKDGRHLRGFISDKNFVSSVMEKAGMRPDRPDAISTGRAGEEGRGTCGRPQ